MPRPETPATDRSGALVAALVLAIAAVLAYADTLHVPFVFDDKASIEHNATLRDLGNLGAVLSPPGEGVTVAGRPVLNLSLAINYALSGLDVGSYHAVNLLIHFLAALTLFGILRQTLKALQNQPGSVGKQRDLSPWEITLASLVAAATWEVHPLNTEAVTYVIQRAESLMGLCYLVTLYGFIRSVRSPHPGRARAWLGLSALACAAGMGTKEAMISAPLIVLAYDWIVFRRSIPRVLASLWPYYAALLAACAWVIILALGTGNRGGTAGFGIDVAPWTYWQTQFQAVAHYLWLSVCPKPLVFDYGVEWSTGFAEIAPYALAVAVLLGLVAYALRRRWTLGLSGLLVLAILAPTSLIPGNRQTMAEHRMYLPLAALIGWSVCGALACLPAAWRRRKGGLLLVPALGIIAFLAVMSFQRNRVYASELTLYQDTVHSRPSNPAAHLNLANTLRDLHRLDEAVDHYEQAIRLRPSYYQAHYDLAIALAADHRSEEAIEHYNEALKIHPDYPEAQNNLGILLARSGRDSAAIPHLTEAVRLRPDYLEAHYNLGLSLARSGSINEAVAQFEEALRLNPNFYPAHVTLGYALQMLGRGREAQEHFQEAQRLQKLHAGPP